MAGQSFFECSSDSIGLLKSRVLPNQELNALVLKVVVHKALIVASYPDSPLLELTHNTLASLFGNSRNIAFCACVLVRELIPIVHPNVSNCIRDWALGSTSQDSPNLSGILIEASGWRLPFSDVLLDFLERP